MSNLYPGGVVGTDNVSPIYDPDGLFRIWSVNELYLGQEARGKHIPKVGDLATKITGRKITNLIVTEVNEVTCVPTLVEADAWETRSTFTREDLLFSVVRAPRSETHLLYLDDSVSPHRLSVCQRLYLGGSMTRYCKIFKGTDDSVSGVVISRVFDTGGNLIGENIPLERSAIPMENGGVQAYCWTVAPAHTNFKLADGEICTAVFYNDQGGVVERAQLKVYNTVHVRPIGADKKYITSIELVCPFISPLEPGLIQYPINVPLSGMNLMGRVNYSTGESVLLPVDGRRFTVFGFEGYEATQSGQSFPVVLKYSLGPQEASYNVTGEADTFIAREYRATTLAADGIFGLKLFCYPQWIDANQGYTLRWWLTNLARDIYYDVTGHVVINTTFRAFDPTAYGTLQRLSVSLNIRRINSFWKEYHHSQVVEVILANQGTERDTNWRVGFSPNQNPTYGAGVHALISPAGTAATWRVNLSLGIATVDPAAAKSEWLERLYRQTGPLYDPSREAAAPTPTHFAVMVGDKEFEFPVDQWSSDLIIGAELKNNATLFVRFIRRAGQYDQQLSVAGLPIWRKT